MLFLFFVHEVFHLIDWDDKGHYDMAFSEANRELSVESQSLSYFIDRDDLRGLSSPVDELTIQRTADKNEVSFAMAVLRFENEDTSCVDDINGAR